MDINKKTTVIIGAGQMGRAAAELLHPNRARLLAFGDNDPNVWTEAGRESGRVSWNAPGDAPVLPVAEALALGPQQVVICVLGEDRAEALKGQVRELGYEGPVVLLREIYELFDLRSRCIGQLAQRVRGLQIPGAVAELGVYRGNTAWQLNALFPDRKLYLFDTFEGFDARDVAREHETDGTDEAGARNGAGSGAGPGGADCIRAGHAKTGRFSDTSAEAVLRRMPHPEHVIVRQGFFPETAVYEGEGPAFALVSLDPDLYAPTLEGLRYFYPRISPGGMIVVHDYDNKQFEGVKRAVEEFEKELQGRGDQPLHMVPLGDLHGSCVILK